MMKSQDLVFQFPTSFFHTHYASLPHRKGRHEEHKAFTVQEPWIPP